MIHQVCAVFDNKTAAYAQPFFTVNLEVAKRSFAAAAADPTLTIGRFPTDYCLFHLGEFDDETGSFRTLIAPENLGLAAIYLKQEK